MCCLEDSYVCVCGQEVRAAVRRVYYFFPYLVSDNNQLVTPHTSILENADYTRSAGAEVEKSVESYAAKQILNQAVCRMNQTKGK